MKDLFITGGPAFMIILTLLLITTAAWIIYHYVIAIKSEATDYEKSLRKIAYGKYLGLFSLIVGIIGQMNGLYAMFSAIENAIKNGKEVIPALVFEGIRVTMIATVYGMLIYLFSLLLWFIASMSIEKKLKV